MDEDELLEIKERLEPFMVSECGRHGVTRVYFMLTNILDESTDASLLWGRQRGNGRVCFPYEPENGAFMLPGVVSRKKQIIPAMMEAAQIMANDFN